MDNIGIPFFNRLAKNISNFKPIPIKAKQAMLTTVRQGKPLPAPIKKALAKRAIIRKSMPSASMVRKSVPAVNVRQSVPAVNVRRSVPSASIVRQSVPAVNVRQTMPPSSGFFNSIKKLINIKNPSVVKSVSPIQRSYMPVDLPYETMSKKKYAMKIPATNFAMPTNIDLVQPPVDGGVGVNYYGK